MTELELHTTLARLDVCYEMLKPSLEAGTPSTILLARKLDFVRSTIRSLIADTEESPNPG
jgi:hypothetical protein